MQAVKVQNTVKSDYIDQNKKNINAVMNFLKENPIEGMYYACYQLEDNNSFMHVNVARNQEIMSKLSDVEAFKFFRESLKASNPIKPPTAEKLDFVGAGWEI